LGAWSQQIIPIRLNFDLCPVSACDGFNEVWDFCEIVPSVAAGVEDGFVSFPHLVSECVGTQIFPDVFDRVQFGRVGGKFQQHDVFGHNEGRRAMPSCAVDHQHGDGARRDTFADFSEVFVHGVGIDAWHDQSRAHAARRTDGAKQIGPVEPAIT
jgi:hypothetical protein